jgi:hypothetical protein
MRAGVVLVVLSVVATSGCASIRARDERQAQRERAAYEKELARQDAIRRAEADRQAEAERQAELKAYQDRLCAAPDTPELAAWCAHRERETDRAAQQAQWDKENQLRERELEVQRQQLAEQKRENRQRAIQRAFTPPRPIQPAPSYYQPRRSTSCTSQVAGSTVFTNCN